MAATPCVIVFGQGRNGSEDDARANASWNDVNRTFNAQVASDLSAAGLRVHMLLAPVEVSDLAAIIGAITARADREGCTRIVETTIFADDAEHVLIVRLRAYPILPGVAAGLPSRIGDPLYTDQQEFQLTQRTLERLVPAALGKEMAAGYLRQLAR